MRRRVGADVVICEESAAEVAEVVAATLPELRGRAEESVGLTAPPVRVVITSKPPAVWQYYRPTLSLVGWVLGVTGGLTLAAAFIGWVIEPDYSWTLLFVSVALMLIGARLRGYGLLLFLAGLILAGAGWPLTFPVIALPAIAVMAAVAARSVRRIWPFLGGFAFAWGHFLRPVIALHWPPPVRVAAVDYLLYHPFSTDDRVRSILAHEYTHLLLHARPGSRPPAWLDEGLAFWLSEQLTGVVVCRPESRECIAEPEPSKDARRSFGGEEPYYRLMARYYWEVRTLAEAGKLSEVLGASAEGLARLRGEVGVGRNGDRQRISEQHGNP